MFNQYSEIEKLTNIQSIADMFKALVDSLDIFRPRLQAILNAITRFERCGWHPQLMDEILERVTPVRFEVRNHKLHFYPGDDKTEYTAATIHYVLESYIEAATYKEQLYDISSAAKYLGISPKTFKYHITYEKHWTPAKRMLGPHNFSLDDLYAFDIRWLRSGRSPQT